MREREIDRERERKRRKKYRNEIVMFQMKVFPTCSDHRETLEGNI